MVILVSEYKVNVFFMNVCSVFEFLMDRDCCFYSGVQYLGIVEVSLSDLLAIK